MFRCACVCFFVVLRGGHRRAPAGVYSREVDMQFALTDVNGAGNSRAVAEQFATVAEVWAYVGEAISAARRVDLPWYLAGPPVA